MYNADGIGIAYVDRDKHKVIVHKTLPASAKEAYKFWRKHAPRDVEYALHWRMRTHGAIDIDRVHPYHVGGGLYLMHNGILSCVPNDPAGVKSDTQIYAEEFAAGLGTIVFNPTVQKLIGAQIGASNRFIFLHPDHGMAIVNEATGVTTERFPGCWFSNTYAWTPGLWGVDNTWQRGYAPKKARARKDTTCEEIKVLCQQLFTKAKAAVPYDPTAQRFINRFDSAAELEDFVRASYVDAADALSDLQAVVEFVDDGAISFAELMDWFNADALQDELVNELDADAAAHIASIVEDDITNDTYSG
jgi:hypothetical protein